MFRVVALPSPSGREKSQLFLQRYMQHFPAAGEIVIFDRSWYNRAGVEYVMRFCTPTEHKRFLSLGVGGVQLKNAKGVILTLQGPKAGVELSANVTKVVITLD